VSALLVRELRLALRAGSGALTGLLFFLAVVVAAPFALGPDLNLLSRIGPALLWIGALLAGLLGLDRLFQADRDDGSLDMLILSGHSLPVIVLVKCLAHWLTTGLPLVVASPVLGLLLNISGQAMLALVATLLCGTPAITLIGAVGAAVTVALPRGGLLIAILVLPLAIPVLIFGIAATQGAIEDPAPFLSPFLILCAMTLFFSVLGPLAAALALRHAVE
jgi:heme exporter protein B